MDEWDRAIRNGTYQLFVELGRAPTTAEVGAVLGSTATDVQSVWRRLHDAHALVLHAGRDELRMANPLSAIPTAHRVHAADRWWYANCAWDAVGICAALHSDGVIETSCPDCGEVVNVEICDQRPSDDALLFHCLVPATSWWDDIVYT